MCTLFRVCCVLRWSRSSLCRQSEGLWQGWCAWWGSVGGSEPERPKWVSSLTTGRTPEPLNPGLHSVRSTAPWDSSRGALTAPVFWLDPRHSQSWAAELCMTTPAPPFSPPQSLPQIQPREGVCVYLLPQVFMALPLIHAELTVGGWHPQLHTCRHVYRYKIPRCSEHRHMCIYHIYV